MPEFYTRAITLINRQDEIGEKQLSVFGSRGGQNSPLMHVPLSDKSYLELFHNLSSLVLNSNMGFDITISHGKLFNTGIVLIANEFNLIDLLTQMFLFNMAFISPVKWAIFIS